jgi:hypothetical protein
LQRGTCNLGKIVPRKRIKSFQTQGISGFFCTMDRQDETGEARAKELRCKLSEGLRTEKGRLGEGDWQPQKVVYSDQRVHFRTTVQLSRSPARTKHTLTTYCSLCRTKQLASPHYSPQSPSPCSSNNYQSDIKVASRAEGEIYQQIVRNLSI